MAYCPPLWVYKPIYIGLIAMSAFSSTSSFSLHTTRTPLILSHLYLQLHSSTLLIASYLPCSWSTLLYILNLHYRTRSSQWHLPNPPPLPSTPALPPARMALPSVPWTLASTSTFNALFVIRSVVQELRSHATSNHTPLAPKSFRHSRTPAAGTKIAPPTHQAKNTSMT